METKVYSVTVGYLLYSFFEVCTLVIVANDITEVSRFHSTHLIFVKQNLSEEGKNSKDLIKLLRFAMSFELSGRKLKLIMAL